MLGRAMLIEIVPGVCKAGSEDIRYELVEVGPAAYSCVGCDKAVLEK